jgi:hypothetical protein
MNRTWYEIQLKADATGSSWLDDPRWQESFQGVLEECDEKLRRQVVGLLSLCVKYGGQKKLAELAGMCVQTVAAGRREVVGDAKPCDHNRVRRPGAGRPKKEETDPGIERALLKLIEEHKAGDPQSLDVWVGRSLKRLQIELAQRGHGASKGTLRRLLKKTGSLSSGIASVSPDQRTLSGIRSSNT